MLHVAVRYDYLNKKQNLYIADINYAIFKQAYIRNYYSDYTFIRNNKEKTVLVGMFRKVRLIMAHAERWTL